MCVARVKIVSKNYFGFAKLVFLDVEMISFLEWNKWKQFRHQSPFGALKLTQNNFNIFSFYHLYASLLNAENRIHSLKP